MHKIALTRGHPDYPSGNFKGMGAAAADHRDGSTAWWGGYGTDRIVPGIHGLIGRLSISKGIVNRVKKVQAGFE
jgi:hypothetical protein